MVLGKRKPLSNLQRTSSASSSGISRADKLKKWKEDKAMEQENLVQKTNDSEHNEKIKVWKKKVALVESRRKALQEKVAVLEKALEQSRPARADSSAHTVMKFHHHLIPST